jgi:peptidoglycan/LPS O-acetylase OafA/YrhL
LVRVLRTPWLRSFGKYSYGIYVFHVPIYRLAEHVAVDFFKLAMPLHGINAFGYLAAVFGASYGVAWVSFHCFEQYFLNLKRYFEPTYTREPGISSVRTDNMPAPVPTA